MQIGGSFLVYISVFVSGRGKVFHRRAKTNLTIVRAVSTKALLDGGFYFPYIYDNKSQRTQVDIS